MNSLWILIFLVIITILIVIPILTYILTTRYAKFYSFKGHDLILSPYAIAEDPNNANQPYYFIFINNTANSLEADGTFEHPFPTLLQAQNNSVPGNIFYVFPGDGTLTGMNHGIVLQTNQKFWGSSLIYSLQPTQGLIIIPAQSINKPLVSNTTGDGIQLAINNHVAGINITNTYLNGIYGTNSISVGNNTLWIESCSISNSQFNQCHLDFYSITEMNNMTFDNLTMTNGQQLGLYIRTDSPSSIYNIENTIINNPNGQCVDLATPNATMSFEHNSIIGQACLIDFQGTAQFTVIDNTFIDDTSISSAPLDIVSADSLIMTITNNLFDHNTVGAVRLGFTNIDSQIFIDSNTITNNGTGSQGSVLGSAIVISPNVADFGNTYIELKNNIISTNTGSSFFCSSGTVFYDLQVVATNNQCYNNGGAGLAFNNFAHSLNLTATNNIFSNGGDAGIATDSVLIPTSTLSLSSNMITGCRNGSSGLYLGHSGNMVNLTLIDNNFSNNDGSGVITYSADGIDTMTATLEGNTMSNNLNTADNASSGLDIEQFSYLCLHLLNNTFMNNVDPGVYIGSILGSPTTTLVEMTGNINDGNYSLSNPEDGIFNLAPTNVSIVNTGTIETSGVITTVSSCNC